MPEQTPDNDTLKAMFDAPEAADPEPIVPDTLDKYDEVAAEQDTTEQSIEQETVELPTVSEAAPEDTEQAEARRQIAEYNEKLLHHVFDKPDGAYVPMRLNQPEAGQGRHEAEELVDDASIENPTLKDLIESSQAVALRDDLAEGADQGMRLYRGALADKEIFFEEHLVKREVVSESGEPRQIYERTAFAVSAGTAEGALNGARQPKLEIPTVDAELEQASEEPTLAEQQQRLQEINIANAKELEKSGVLDKVATELHHQVYAKDQEHRLKAGQQPEDTDEQAMARMADTIQAMTAYARYGVSHEVRDDLSEHFSVTRDYYDNVTVGISEIDPSTGEVVIRPTPGFTEEDVIQVRDMTNHLEELRLNGTMPDLLDNVAAVHNHEKEMAERQAAAEVEQGGPELADLKQQQAERDEADKALIENMQASGATEEQIDRHRQRMERMKTDELERGRLFPSLQAYEHFKMMVNADDELDMAPDNVLEQAQDVLVVTDDDGNRESWTFMGINRKTGLAKASKLADTGYRLDKELELSVLLAQQDQADARKS